MKIVCISDTHESHRGISVPDGDVLLFAGDMSFLGEACAIKDFNAWLGNLPHKHKVVIAGNHDWLFERDPERAKSLLWNATYLNDSGCTVDGLKIWGSPIQPRFCDWAFNRQRGEPINKHWQMIPGDTDILITHGPPFGIGDTSRPGGENLGCAMLRKAVARVNPKLHVFGHIHGGAGFYVEGETTFVNASVLNEAYKPNGLQFATEIL